MLRKLGAGRYGEDGLALLNEAVANRLMAGATPALFKPPGLTVAKLPD